MVCPEGVQLFVDEIIAAGADPKRTAYDIIRIPIFRGDWEFFNNHIESTLAFFSRCTCPNVEHAVQLLTQARLLLGTNDGDKAAYNSNLLVPQNTLVTAIPIPAVPTVLATTLSIASSPHLFNPGVHDLGDDKGSHVQCVKTMLWRLVNPVLLPRNRENTFWLSLSFGLKDNFKYWAELKARTCQYYNNVMADNTHPRNGDYTVLNNNTQVRAETYAAAGNHISVSNLPAQLQPTLPLANVTPELWQVVADAFKIELMVIIDGTYKEGKTKTAGKKFLPVIPRGDHNSRQVWIYMLAHDFKLSPHEYRAIVPIKHDRFQFRYIAHMPLERTKPPPPGPIADKDQAQRNLSSWRRCPFLVHDENGVYDASLTMMAGKLGPAMAPRAILDDSASNNVTDQQILEYWNNGAHNP